MDTSAPSALIHNLKRLAVLRLITCSGIALALWFFGQEPASNLQRFSAWGILVLMTLLSLLNLWRARSHNALPHEMFSYLLIDTLLIVALMYFSGGANNPHLFIGAHRHQCRYPQLVDDLAAVCTGHAGLWGLVVLL